MEKQRIISSWEYNICLFCGKEIDGRYEEYLLYYECECPDAKKKRQIEDQIRKLEDSIPEEKFSIVKENVLYKK